MRAHYLRTLRGAAYLAVVCAGIYCTLAGGSPEWGFVPGAFA